MSSSLELPASACCQDRNREEQRKPWSAGFSFARQLVVDRDRTIDVMGEQARVYATPMLVRDVEIACREELLAHVEPGQDSVGTRVEIDHLAATPIGMTVRLELTVAAIEGRQVTFTFEGHDGFDTICRGRHLRMVIDVERTAARIAAKVARAAQAGTGSGEGAAASPGRAGAKGA